MFPEPSAGSRIEGQSIDLAEPGYRENGSTGRLAFVDAAKGLSIILVVALHAGTYWHFNEFLRFIRMPLFFFVAGLFASRSMNLPWADFLSRKVGNTFYIFGIWVLFGWLVRYNVGEGGLSEWLARFPTSSNFVAPVDPLWFMYALGILYLCARLLRQFFSVTMILCAFGVSFLVSFDGGVPDDLVYAKAAKAFPFFLIAVIFHSEVKRLVERFAGYWLLPTCAYFLAYYGIGQAGAVAAILLAPMISVLGLTAVLLGFARFESSWITRVFAIFGSMSLFIYLLHGVAIFHLRQVMVFLDISRSDLIGSLSVLPIAFVCVAVGRYLLKPTAPWLFAAPWVSASKGQ